MAKPKPTIESIMLASIDRNPTLNSRAKGVNEAIAQEYSQAIAGGDELPPVVVYRDGDRLVLADGWHRCRAAELAGKAEIACEVRAGGEREARLYSVGCNAAHGLRRTSADKRHAVTVLLLDDEWTKKSDRWIAEACGVSDPFVGKLRSKVQTVSTSKPATREGRDGKQQPASKQSRKKGAKPSDPVRAAKLARKDLDKLAKRWGEPVAVPAVQAWLAERVTSVYTVPAGPVAKAAEN